MSCPLKLTELLRLCRAVGLEWLISLFLSFFVSLLVRLRENGWTDLHEICMEGVEWPWDDLITFWSIPRNRAMPRCATRRRDLLCFSTTACSIIIQHIVSTPAVSVFMHGLLNHMLICIGPYGTCKFAVMTKNDAGYAGLMMWQADDCEQMMVASLDMLQC